MADDAMNNGEFSDAQSVEIGGDDDSPKTSGLTQKIGDLERENGKIIRQNEDYRQQIDELTVSNKELSSENAERKKELEELQSENRMLGAVAARAAELEGEVSRLQHDLVSTMSDLQESTTEISNLKRDLEGVKEREKDKGVALDAVVKERDLLLAKVGELEGVERSLRGESEGKEKEIRSLKTNLEELEVVLESNKVLETLRSDLEETVEKLKGKISDLESSLVEKLKVITGFETEERAAWENVNGDDASVDGGTKGLIEGLKEKNWVVVGGSTIAAVAVMGVVCYVHAAKKH